MPGFPAPFQVAPGANARNYWMREDVLAYFATKRTPVAPPAASSPVSPKAAVAALAKSSSLPSGTSVPDLRIASVEVSPAARAAAAARLAGRSSAPRRAR